MTRPAFEIRHYVGPEDLDLLLGLPYALNHEVAGDLDTRRRRREWTWLAVGDGRLLGRLALWSTSSFSEPMQLDIFDTDSALPEEEQREVGEALFDAARTEVLGRLATPPEFARYLPADWRDHAASRRTTEMLINILESRGARFVVERLRLEWRAGTPIAAPDPRLSFRSFHTIDELIDLTTRALTGTLDAHSTEELANIDPAAVARAQYDEEFAKYGSPREWWRVATDVDGGPVGFVFPARNAYHPIVAYLGVLPEHRGNGYVDGILSEATRLLDAAGAGHIRASTDVGNVPMANAFARNGYATFERLINMTWQPASDDRRV
ncbi:GNAT family N-acetyltransferase [Leifsonia flava]|uniref:GNAT family N-acetyltransferase n=1 Tax=Orlajensenia leifsoniae TaxID=2561933 RepID=A0A4Y9R5I6_9MICO|nr:GNAT family N-acetyltransferase [Leifsonia flava]TFV99894.1 GNAT family N-acetyltransferase [Leifsonia flava]